MTYRSILAALVALFLATGALARAGAPEPSLSLTLKNHIFTPAILNVPKGARVRVNLANLDAATEEFDSHDLRVEQLVTPHSKTSFAIGPLKPGIYTFMGEFHPGTARGQIVVGER